MKAKQGGRPRKRPTVTLEMAQAWFLDAIKGKRARMPDDAALAEFARLLNAYNPPPFEALPRTAAARYGKLFVHSLYKERERLLAPFDHDLPGAAEFRERAKASIEAANEAVERFLQWADLPPARDLPAHDFAEFVGVCARSAWKTTGRIPRAVGEEQPLCLLVTRVLAELGYRGEHDDELSARAVSDILRGKRGNGLLVGFDGGS